MNQTLPAVQAETAPAAPVAPIKRSRPENPYARSYANFIENTTDHAITVVLDDGLNRRFRVGAPGASWWSWRVATWPGYLATYGDIADGFMFARDTDMLEFFEVSRGSLDYYADGAPSIDFRYWAEKLSGGRYHDVKEFSRDRFIQHVSDRLGDHDDLGIDAETEHQKIVEVAKRVTARNGIAYEDYVTELREKGTYRTLEIDPEDDDEVDYFDMPIPEESPAQRRAQIIDEAKGHGDSEQEAREWLREQQELFGEDDYMYAEMRDFNVHFLFACWAIALSVRLWREYEKSNDAKALAAATQATGRGLIDLARSRVDAEFKISTDLEVGDLSNGALVLRLAEALAEQITSRPAYVEQPAVVETPGDSYVHVAGGIVQNSPSLPVFDVDVLDSDAPNEADALEALELYQRIGGHAQARIDLGAPLSRAAAFIRDHGAAATIASVEILEAARLAAARIAA